MQTIQTTYIGPTDSHGSRVMAACASGSVTVAWDYALDSDANHAYAARVLAKMLGWTRPKYKRASRGN